MFDLSFDDDGVVTKQAAMVTKPENSQIDSQNGHHTAAGLTRQTWTCPMCNEQFEEGWLEICTLNATRATPQVAS